MEKTATLNIRVNPEDKKAAEAVLEQLGIPVSTAVTIFLKKIAMTGGIPFSVRLPQAPSGLDTGRMTDAEIRESLMEGIREADAGMGIDASEAFRHLKESQTA